MWSRKVAPAPKLRSPRLSGNIKPPAIIAMVNTVLTTRPSCLFRLWTLVSPWRLCSAKYCGDSQLTQCYPQHASSPAEPMQTIAPRKNHIASSLFDVDEWLLSVFTVVSAAHQNRHAAISMKTAAGINSNTVPFSMKPHSDSIHRWKIFPSVSEYLAVKCMTKGTGISQYQNIRGTSRLNALAIKAHLDVVDQTGAT